MLSQLFIILSQFMGILSHWDYVTIFNKGCHNNEEFCRTRFFVSLQWLSQAFMQWWWWWWLWKWWWQLTFFDDSMITATITWILLMMKIDKCPFGKKKTLGMCRVKTFWQFLIFFDRSTDRPTNQHTNEARTRSSNPG